MRWTALAPGACSTRCARRSRSSAGSNCPHFPSPRLRRADGPLLPQRGRKERTALSSLSHEVGEKGPSAALAAMGSEGVSARSFPERRHLFLERLLIPAL